MKLHKLLTGLVLVLLLVGGGPVAVPAPSLTPTLAATVAMAPSATPAPSPTVSPT